MAMSAFSAFVEAAWMAWLVIPMLVIGAIFFICSLIVTWKIKNDLVYKKYKSHEHDKKVNK